MGLLLSAGSSDEGGHDVGGVTVEALPGGRRRGWDRAPARRWPDRSLGRARGERDGDLLAALAHDPKGAVTTFDVEVLDVGRPMLRRFVARSTPAATPTRGPGSMSRPASTKKAPSSLRSPLPESRRSTARRSVAIHERLPCDLYLVGVGSLWFATDQGLPADTDGSTLPITVADCRPGDAEDGISDG